MYSFEIEFLKYERKIPLLDDTRAIYVSGICIVAKNNKHGEFYFSKFVKKVVGRFTYVAGSVRYPMLYPKGKGVVMTIAGFPKYPVLENITKYNQHISIKNICLDGEKN